ncbi:ABC transporter ATP-binding protein [Spirillospora sp. CA-255316]
MLHIDKVSMRFGGVQALTDVTVRVGPGEVVGVIGPNGSGKSTLINVMTGFYRPTHGQVLLGDSVLSRQTPEQIRAQGIARTFQNLRLVQELSVLDNVVSGLHLRQLGRTGLTSAWIGDVFGGTRSRRRTRECREAALNALERVGLADKPGVRASALSYADQKRLELARAIAMRPRVLVLDEPTAGMSGQEADELVRMLIALVDDADVPLSLFLVEHRLELVLDVSTRAVVMDGGRVVVDGAPGTVAHDPEVRRIYVGGE